MSIEINLHGHVADIVLSNPDKRNVLDLESSTDLKEAVAEASANTDIKALMVSARGRAFCAGGSLDELLAVQEDPGVLHEVYAGFRAVAECPLPTIGLIQGPAVGAGMNLALACDVRLTAPEARFDTRFMQLGIHCGGGHSWLLLRALGWQESVAALMFGETISGEEAVNCGLALECLPASQLRERALALAAALAEVPRELVEKTKDTLARASREPEHGKMLEHEFRVQSWSLVQPRAMSRLNAFRERISGQQPSSPTPGD